MYLYQESIKCPYVNTFNKTTYVSWAKFQIPIEWIRKSLLHDVTRYNHYCNVHTASELCCCWTITAVKPYLFFFLTDVIDMKSVLLSYSLDQLGKDRDMSCYIVAMRNFIWVFRVWPDDRHLVFQLTALGHFFSCCYFFVLF